MFFNATACDLPRSLPLSPVWVRFSWPERARKAAVGLSASAQDNDPVGSLLMDILELFLRWHKERVFTKDIAAWLNMAEERPWMVLKKRKEVTGQWVAQQLQAYGVRPRTLRIGDERAKGYELDDLREAFRRYIPRSEYEAFKTEVREEAAMTEERKAKAAQAKLAAPGSGAGGVVAAPGSVVR